MRSRGGSVSAPRPGPSRVGGRGSCARKLGQREGGGEAGRAVASIKAPRPPFSCRPAAGRGGGCPRRSPLSGAGSMPPLDPHTGAGGREAGRGGGGDHALGGGGSRAGSVETAGRRQGRAGAPLTPRAWLPGQRFPMREAARGGGGSGLSREGWRERGKARNGGAGGEGRRDGGGLRTSQNLAPIWLPHWPPWMCTISRMAAGGGGGWLFLSRSPSAPLARSDAPNPPPPHPLPPRAHAISTLARRSPGARGSEGEASAERGSFLAHFAFPARGAGPRAGRGGGEVAAGDGGRPPRARPPSRAPPGPR